jgi:hypothetical protein
LLEDKRVKKKSFGGSYVDEFLIEKGGEGVYIATLDNGIKRQVPNKVVINSSSKSLEIIRS